MNRTGLASIVGVLVGLAMIGASCGDELSDADLPPMYVTTTSTTSNETTTTEALRQYAVKAGDLLGNIARAYGVGLQELMDLNGITNPDRIEIGQVLKIPPSTLPVDETLPPP